MKKIIRRVIALLLCVTAMLLIFIPSPDSLASTVKGDYEMDGSVIVKYLGNEDRVSIPNNVTQIGKDAFADCQSLVKVTIPDSVSRIGYQAFHNCVNLEQAVLPSTIKQIDSSAFSGCVRLSSVNIPEKTKSLGSGVFAGCSSLSNVAIDSRNIYYYCSDGVIYNKDGNKVVQYLAGRPKTSYSMPSSINRIEEYAFWGANNLTALTISPNVKTIPEYAFANCSGLTDVALPYGVESLMAFSFADCKSLRNIYIPDSVGYIDVNAFAMSQSASLDFEGEASNGEAFPSGSVSGNESVSGNALERDENGDAVYHGDNPVSDRGPTTTAGPNPTIRDYGQSQIVGGNALVFVSKDTHLKGFDVYDAETEDDVSESGPGGLSIVNNGDYYLVNGVFSRYTGDDQEFDIPEDTEVIGSRAFYRNESLGRVNIPSSVQKIGDFSFAKSSVSEVNIPDSVTDIGYAAFYQCPGIRNIDIPSSVKNIELSALEGTSYIENWKNDSTSGNYLIVGDGILLYYKGGGGNISIPDGVKTIGAQCFYNNKSITGVKFPDSLTKIGEDAFNGCTSLRNIELPSALSVIEDRAFMNTGLSEVIIPISVSSIGIGAFDNVNTKAINDVVFLGNKLPEISYKPTASRLSALEIRTPAFNGVENVIISPNADLSGVNSAASKYVLGVRGQIYQISDSSKSPAELELITSLSEPDQDGNVVIDPHVMAGGRNYVLARVKDGAFDNYGEENYYNGVLSWAKEPLKSISVDGNNSDALNSLLDGVYRSGEEPSINEGNAIRVTCYDGFSDSSGAFAVIPGSADAYDLVVTKDDSVKDLFVASVKNEYPGSSIDLVPLDISLYSMRGNVKITKLGTGKLEVCIPVPDELRGKNSLKVAALDENYVYEPLSATQTENGGVPCIRFIASHLSYFAVFSTGEGGSYPGAFGFSGASAGDAPSFGNVVNVEGEARFSGNRIEGVIDTLNKKAGNTFIEIKWFIIIILLSLAMILFLIKDRKKT